MTTESTPPLAAGGSPVERGVRPKPPMRAWRVYVPSWQAGPMSLTMAPTRGVAIMRNLASAMGAGYALHWKDFKAMRAAEFDGAFEAHGYFSWGYEHAMLMLRPNVRREPAPTARKDDDGSH